MNVTTVVPSGISAADAQREFGRIGNQFAMKICSTRNVANYAGSSGDAGKWTPNSVSAGATQVTFRKGLYFPEMVVELRFVFSSFYIDQATQGDTALGNALVLTGVGFEPYDGATPIRVTFNGAASYTFPGAQIKEYVVSDPIRVKMAAASTGWIRTTVNTTLTGDFVPGQEFCNNATCGDSYQAATDLSQSTTKPSQTSSSQRMYGPMGCLGIILNQQRPVWGIIGDSRSVSTSGSDSDQGMIRRALAGSPYTGTAGLLAARNAYMHMGRAGATIRDWIRPENAAYISAPKDADITCMRTLLAPYCDCFIVELGTNDLTAGASNLSSRIIDLIGRYSAMGPVYVMTLPPRTTSSDAWATTANQTVGANEAARINFNQNARGTGNAPLLANGAAGIFDIASRVEVNAANVLTVDGGFWIVTGAANYATDDGIHESVAADVLECPMLEGMASVGLV